MRLKSNESSPPWEKGANKSCRASIFSIVISHLIPRPRSGPLGHGKKRQKFATIDSIPPTHIPLSESCKSASAMRQAPRVPVSGATETSRTPPRRHDSPSRKRACLVFARADPFSPLGILVRWRIWIGSFLCSVAQFDMDGMTHGAEVRPLFFPFSSPWYHRIGRCELRWISDNQASSYQMDTTTKFTYS